MPKIIKIGRSENIVAPFYGPQCRKKYQNVLNENGMRETETELGLLLYRKT